MTQTLKKTFDLGIAVAVTVVILNLTVSSLGFGSAETQKVETASTLQIAQATTIEATNTRH